LGGEHQRCSTVPVPATIDVGRADQRVGSLRFAEFSSD
jgi:hypothetical protein